MVPQRIEREILIEAPVDVVWEVVTDPEHISGWFSDSVELDLTPGGKVLLQWDGRGGVPGRVERVERPHFFSFRWAVGPSVPGEEHWTLVEFRLSAEGDSTRLRVVESGFRDIAGSEDEKQDYFDSHSRGWGREIGDLVAYVIQQGGR